MYLLLKKCNEKLCPNFQYTEYKFKNINTLQNYHLLQQNCFKNSHFVPLEGSSSTEKKHTYFKNRIGRELF